MEKQIWKFIRECDIFQHYKYNNIASPGLLQPLPIPEEDWSQVSLDYIEGLPLSHGNSTILVVVDRLTRYSHFMSLTHPYSVALTVAQDFLDHVFKLHGLPSILISDHNKVFLRNFWSDFSKLQGVELHMSTTYHPQSDGLMHLLLALNKPASILSIYSIAKGQYQISNTRNRITNCLPSTKLLSLFG